jgi:hypothetical protein
LAAVCDRVVLVVAGQPVTVKDTALGALPTHGPTRKQGTGGPPARRAGG